MKTINKITRNISEFIADAHQRRQLSKTRRWLRKRALNYYVATH